MLSPAAALEQILATCAPLGAEQVELSAALGRVLAAGVVSDRVLPPWDNSAMDGYAVRAAGVVPERAMPVVAVIAAGRPAQVELLPGQAMRIMTGAPVPAGADAIIMKEEADEARGEVRFRKRPVPGEHVRHAGEDVAHGDPVLAAGTLIQAGEIGLLSALGRTLVVVHRRPQVAIVSTGDELVPADRPPGPGQIVGSNAHALAAQVCEAGGVPVVLPIAPDDRQALRTTFGEALRADVVISSGGVSVGEFDYVKEVLAALSVEERFWLVAMKPGKPLSFGVRHGHGGVSIPVFGLPGNPASSMVSFELFVRPALRRLCGMHTGLLRRPLVRVLLGEKVRPDARRLLFLRAEVRRDQDGMLRAFPKSHQGSGMLRSMIGVNALLEISPGEAPLREGDEVPAHLLQPV